MWRTARTEARHGRLAPYAVAAAFLALAAFPALYVKVRSRFAGEERDVLARTFHPQPTSDAGGGG